MATNEQMYLCTLTPFKTSFDFEGSVEAAVAINWRYNEVKFTGPGGSSSIGMTSMRSSSWLNLCGNPFCKITAVLRQTDLVPLGIRIFLQKEPIVNVIGQKAVGLSEAHIQFHTFEAHLETVLGGSYVIETIASKKKTFDPVERFKVDVPVGLKLADGLFWSFRDLTFTREQPEAFVIDRIRPTALVSDCTDEWRDQVLSLVSKKKTVVSSDLVQLHHVSLVVTMEPHKWRSTAGPYLEFMSRGLPICDLEQASVVTITPTNLQLGIANAYNLIESIEYAMKSTTGQAHRTKTQVRRVITENLIPKLPSFVVPVSMIQFGSIVFDDIEQMGHISSYLLDNQALRFLQVVKTSLTKPKALTRDQLVKCYTCHAPFVVPHLEAVLETSILTVPVPKSTLRKVRILGHPVKNGPIEDRISKMFSQRYSPVSLADNLQRFSGRLMPKDVAEGLIQRHFQRTTVSLGTFVEASSAQDTPISSAFVERQLLQDTTTCCVCFESLGAGSATGSATGSASGPTTFTICGHSYCKDCTRQHFLTEWNSGRSKECGQCRHLLSVGDTFLLGPFSAEKPYVPTVTAMSSAMNNFLSSCRVQPKLWSPNTLYEPSVKTLISNDVSKIDAKALLQTFSRSPQQNVTLHVFYTSDETTDFQRLQNAFSFK